MSKRTVSVQRMQLDNRIKVLKAVRDNKHISRPKIAEITGLSLSSVTNIINYLTEQRLVLGKGVEDVTRVGRKADIIVFDNTAYNFVLFSIDKEFIKAAHTDLSGKVLKSAEYKTDSADRDYIVNIIIKAANELSDNRTIAVGITASGFVENGVICSSSLGWVDFDLQNIIEEKIKIPVLVENSTIVKAAYEFYCKNEDNEENALFVDCEGGIGAVRIFGGKIDHASTGEIGHTIVRTQNGGHEFLEDLCSGEKLEKICGRSYAEIENTALSTGEFRKELDECLDFLSIGLANLVNIYNPLCIVLNRGKYFNSAYADKYIRDSIQRYLFTKSFAEIRNTKTDVISLYCGMSELLSDKLIQNGNIFSE